MLPHECISGPEQKVVTVDQNKEGNSLFIASLAVCRSRDATSRIFSRETWPARLARRSVRMDLGVLCYLAGKNECESQQPCFQ